MMPRHCKDVAFKRVDFPLTEEAIRKRFEGERVFTRTEYFILENCGKYAVVGVKRKRGIELFRPVSEVEIVSLPESTAFVHDPECDVLSPHSMARHAAAHSEETVVVLGKFEHISFIKGGKSPVILRVIDVVPPYPSKTVEMVELALRTGTIRTPVLVEPVLFDAVKLCEGHDSSVVMFPCEAGKVTVGGRPVRYLDKTPRLEEGESVTLAGCELSRRIFRITYGHEPDFVNICPRDLARRHFEPGKLHIARCCDVHRVIVEPGLALVQYGATMGEIIVAIKALLGETGETGETGSPGTGEPETGNRGAREPGNDRRP
jgi:hypothetical protein